MITAVTLVQSTHLDQAIATEQANSCLIITSVGDVEMAFLIVGAASTTFSSFLMNFFVSFLHSLVTAA
jgi:hypothetical protein